MKPTYLALVLALIPVFGHSQMCTDGISINEYDEIKEARHVRTRYFSYERTLSANYTFSLELLDHKAFLVATSTDPDVNSYGGEIGILFSDGTSHLFEFAQSYETKAEFDQPIYHNRLELTLDQLNDFAEKSLESVKHYATEKTYDLKEKKSRLFKRYATCFLSQIDPESDFIESSTVQPDEVLESVVPSYYEPCNITVNEVDDFEGYRKKQLHYAAIAKSSESGLSFFITLTSYDGVLWMTAKLDGFSYCISRGDNIRFKLENDVIVSLPHLGDIECEEGAMFLIRFSDSEKEQLRQSPISKIRLQTQDGNVDLEFIQIERYFIENIDCI